MNHIQIMQDAFAIYGRQYRSLGDYSATTLISPPRQVALTKRYGHLVEPSIDSQVASLLGTAVHEKMESLLHLANVKNPDYMLEKSVAHAFEVETGSDPHNYVTRLVAGKFDILKDEKHLYDIKTCKTWKLVFDPEMTDWHEQQNIYAYLLGKRGIQVESLNILAFYLDWMVGQSLRDKKYPQAPIVEYKLKLWDEDYTGEFIQHKLDEHVKCEDTEDDYLPYCSQEEMWARPSEFALMKNESAKRATKVIRDGTFEDALRAARECRGLGSDSYLEVRHGIRKRCESYCSVNEYCNQYKMYAANKSSNGLNEMFPLKEVL